jgi:putative pyruvate formate lyase activating enzyme
VNATVYRWGIHQGEEPFVVGNRRAGMVTFSGCHLRCQFCYTPETSVRKEGESMGEARFANLLETLVARGSENLTLISPTHVWPLIERPLTRFKQSFPIPVVAKISGYETPSLLKRLTGIADVVVPDFKVLSSACAQKVNLPPDYGDRTSEAIGFLSDTLGDGTRRDGRLTKGTVVRHLIMPGFEDDSLAVVERLNEIGYRGALNLMTHFINVNHPTLVTADSKHVERLVREAQKADRQVFVNARRVCHVH